MASNAMWVACIDIKPANVVLNTDTMDVRMIDLDGDFCTVIPVQIQSIDTTINSYFEACMLMACHFLVIDYNIFADYVASFDINELSEALYNRLSGDNIHMVYWLQMVKHYFKNLKSDEKPQNEFDVKFWMKNVILWSRMRDTKTPRPITAVDPTSCKYRDPEKKKCVTKTKFKNHIYDGKPIPKPKKVKPCVAGKERSCTTNRCKKIEKYPVSNVDMEMPPAPSPEPEPKHLTSANKRVLYRALAVEKAKLANVEKTQPPKKGKKVSFISPNK
jgi:hypothetical protein